VNRSRCSCRRFLVRASWRRCVWANPKAVCSFSTLARNSTAITQPWAISSFFFNYLFSIVQFFFLLCNLQTCHIFNVIQTVNLVMKANRSLRYALVDSKKIQISIESALPTWGMYYCFHRFSSLASDETLVAFLPSFDPICFLVWTSLDMQIRMKLII